MTDSEILKIDTYRLEYYVLIHVNSIFVAQRSRSQLDLKVGRVGPFYKLWSSIKSVKINILKNEFQIIYLDSVEHVHSDFEQFFRPWVKMG